MTFQVWQMVAGKWFMVRAFNTLAEAENFKARLDNGSRVKCKIKQT